MSQLTATSPCVLWTLLGSSQSNIHFIIGSVYVPGYNSKFANENDFDKISEDILAFREKYNCPFILMGDFNSRTGSTTRISMDKKIDTYGRNLITMCNDCNLKIVNGCFGSDQGIAILHATRKMEQISMKVLLIIVLFPSV